MPSVILLTGVIGAGKSTVTEKFSPPAFAVHADPLQHDAVRRAFPFVRREHEFRWEVWPRDCGMLHMNRLFGMSLKSTHGGIYQHRADVIAEGCVLCNDWFYKPLLEAIKVACQFDDNVTVHWLNLIPPADQVLEQILTRNRKHELAEFGNLEGVKRHIGYAEERTRNGWERFSDQDSLEARIRTIIEAS